MNKTDHLMASTDLYDFVSLDDIKSAVHQGQEVYWMDDSRAVIQSPNGEYLIKEQLGIFPRFFKLFDSAAAYNPRDFFHRVY